jgi:hypothetical protein
VEEGEEVEEVEEEGLEEVEEVEEEGLDVVEEEVVEEVVVAGYALNLIYWNEYALL